MELLDRYLQAIRFLLPKRQQDDIVRELSENLISKMEDREAELGRPLSEGEQADILRDHGHPMVVAGRYRSRQHLIGSTFFPIYLFILKIGLAAALLVSVIVAVVTAALYGDPIRHALEAFLRFPGQALMVFAWTTLAIAGLDFAQSRLRLSHNWDPRSLPKVIRCEDRISRAHSTCEVIVGLACVVWLLLLPKAPHLLLGPAAAILGLAPIWQVVYVPIVALALAAAALSFVNLVRPYRTATRSLLRIAMHAVSVVVIAVLLRAGVWVLALPGARLPDGTPLDGIVDLVNTGLEIGLMVGCAAGLIEIAREVYRWKSRRKTDSRPFQNGAAKQCH